MSRRQPKSVRWWALALWLSGACGLSPSLPDSARLHKAAWNAATDSRTWIPAAGSGVFLALGVDDRVSDWGQRNTPVFGSVANAQRNSDSLRTLAHRSMDIALLSHFYTEEISSQSWQQVGLGYGSAITSTETAGALKRLVGRDRPHPSPLSPSWPSQHATRAFAYSSSARAAFKSAGTRNPFSSSIIAMGEVAAIGCAWARVESGAHYPSDVLAGAALGNFTTLLIQEAFDLEDSALSLVAFPGPEGLSLQVGWGF